MRKPTVAIAAAIMLIAGQAVASSTPQAGDRVSPPRADAAESEGYFGFSGATFAIALASLAAAVLIYNELDEDDEPASP